MGTRILARCGQERVFFIYHHQKHGEEADPKDAILFFYPPSVDIKAQIALVGGIMGTVDFCIEILQHIPSIVTLTSCKFALLKAGPFLLGLSGSLSSPEQYVTQHLRYLWDTFCLFQGSLTALQQRLGVEGFLLELSRVWTCYFSLCQSFCDELSEAFALLPYTDLSLNQSGVFLQASHLLQTAQTQTGIIGGLLLNKNRVLCTQLSIEITRRLLLLMPQERNFPYIGLKTDFDLPTGVRLLCAFLTPEELSSLGPCKRYTRKDQHLADGVNQTGAVPPSFSTASLTQSATVASCSEASFRKPVCGLSAVWEAAELGEGVVCGGSTVTPFMLGGDKEGKGMWGEGEGVAKREESLQQTNKGDVAADVDIDSNTTDDKADNTRNNAATQKLKSGDLAADTDVDINTADDRQNQHREGRSGEETTVIPVDGDKIEDRSNVSCGALTHLPDDGDFPSDTMTSPTLAEVKAGSEETVDDGCNNDGDVQSTREWHNANLNSAEDGDTAFSRKAPGRACPCVRGMTCRCDCGHHECLHCCVHSASCTQGEGLTKTLQGDVSDTTSPNMESLRTEKEEAELKPHPSIPLLTSSSSLPLCDQVVEGTGRGLEEEKEGGVEQPGKSDGDVGLDGGQRQLHDTDNKDSGILVLSALAGIDENAGVSSSLSGVSKVSSSPHTSPWMSPQSSPQSYDTSANNSNPAVWVDVSSGAADENGNSHYVFLPVSQGHSMDVTSTDPVSPPAEVDPSAAEESPGSCSSVLLSDVTYPTGSSDSMKSPLVNGLSTKSTTPTLPAISNTQTPSETCNPPTSLNTRGGVHKDGGAPPVLVDVELHLDWVHGGRRASSALTMSDDILSPSKECLYFDPTLLPCDSSGSISRSGSVSCGVEKEDGQGLLAGTQPPVLRECSTEPSSGDLAQSHTTTLSQPHSSPSSSTTLLSSPSSSRQEGRRVWEGGVEGRRRVVLYVQGHMDTLLVLLIEDAALVNRHIIYKLWKSSLAKLAELDFAVSDANSRLLGDGNNFQSSYLYLKYLRSSRAMQGTALKPVTSMASELVSSSVVLHDTFSSMPQTTNILCKTHTSCCYGHRTVSSETYYQVAASKAGGFPDPHDPAFHLDQKADRKLYVDHGSALL